MASRSEKSQKWERLSNSIGIDASFDRNHGLGKNIKEPSKYLLVLFLTGNPKIDARGVRNKHIDFVLAAYKIKSELSSNEPFLSSSRDSIKSELKIVDD